MVDSDTLVLMLRLVASLAIVIGLMALAAGFMRKRGIVVGGGNGGLRRAGGNGPAIDVIARRPLGRNASLAVVRAGGRTLLVGITEHGINTLSDVDVTDDVDLEVIPGHHRTVPDGTPERPGSPWKTLLDVARDKTVRR